MTSALDPLQIFCNNVKECLDGNSSSYVTDIKIASSSSDSYGSLKSMAKAFLILNVSSNPSLSILGTIKMDDQDREECGFWQIPLTTKIIQTHIEDDCGSGESIQNFGVYFAHAIKNSPSLLMDSCSTDDPHATSQYIQIFPLCLYYNIYNNPIQTIFKIPLVQFPLSSRLYEAVYPLVQIDTSETIDQTQERILMREGVNPTLLSISGINQTVSSVLNTSNDVSAEEIIQTIVPPERERERERERETDRNRGRERDRN